MEKITLCLKCRRRLDVYKCICRDKTYHSDEKSSKNKIDFLVDPGAIPYLESKTVVWKKFLTTNAPKFKWAYISGYMSLQYYIYDLYQEFKCLGILEAATPSEDNTHQIKKAASSARYVKFEERSIAKIAGSSYLKFLFEMGRDEKTMDYFCATWHSLDLNPELSSVKAYHKLVHKLKKETGCKFWIEGKSKRDLSNYRASSNTSEKEYSWATDVKLAGCLTSIPGERVIV